MEFCHKCNCWRRCCPACHCCPQCCSCQCCRPCPSHVQASFTAVKRDRLTNAPLAGAVYTLLLNGRPVAASESGPFGRLCFSNLAPNQYELLETLVPNGYQSETGRHTVIVDADGNVTINGQPADGYSFYDVPIATAAFLKIDAVTGQPLVGAGFTMSNSATAVSDSNGIVNFGMLAPGVYTMTETTVPPGYLPNPTTYQVIVMNDGNVTIDGVAISDFGLGDQPDPSLTFRKYDATTDRPLAGAVFTLSDGRVVTSDGSGLVNFGIIAPGTYTMRETTAPVGFEPNTTVYNVVVTASGDITVSGTPLFDFSVSNTPVRTQSPTPTMNDIIAGDQSIIGQGIAGATIVVTLPDGTQVTTNVNENGIWLAAVPAGLVLQAGQNVTANQIVPGQNPSASVFGVVQARP